MLGPILRGEKVSLEPLQWEDLPVTRHWTDDLEELRSMMEPFPTSAQREEEWYHQMATNENIVFWRIMAQAQLVGVTNIREIDWISRHGITAVHIGERSQRGKGYASDAVRLRTAYAFNELGLERLESESLASNLAMHRVLEKAGYQKIGRKRRYFYSGGAWHDAYIFELLRDEWQTQQV